MQKFWRYPIWKPRKPTQQWDVRFVHIDLLLLQPPFQHFADRGPIVMKGDSILLYRPLSPHRSSSLKQEALRPNNKGKRQTIIGGRRGYNLAKGRRSGSRRIGLGCVTFLLEMRAVRTFLEACS